MLILSIAKFKVNANTYKEYFEILMKLLAEVDDKFKNCVYMKVAES